MPLNGCVSQVIWIFSHGISRGHFYFVPGVLNKSFATICRITGEGTATASQHSGWLSPMAVSELPMLLTTLLLSVSILQTSNQLEARFSKQKAIKILKHLGTNQLEKHLGTNCFFNQKTGVFQPTGGFDQLPGGG